MTQNAVQMPLPHHDIWLRDVLDQQFMGHSWTQVQRGFEKMIAAYTLFYYAWPTPSWAFADDAIELNKNALKDVPADIKVRPLTSLRTWRIVKWSIAK